MTTHTEGTFRGAGGLNLYYQCWRPDGAPRAAVVVVHGILEHSGRYGNVVEALVPHGYVIYANDHRGHGRSPGRRAYVASFDQFRADLKALLTLVHDRDPGLPVFLLGHSMGGLIVLNYALHDPSGLAGVIASGPAVATNTSLPVEVVGRVLARVAPRLPVAMKKGAGTTLSRDPAVGAAYLADPLIPDNSTLRLAAELVAAAHWTAERASEWKLPLLMLHGGADKLVPPEGSRRFFELVPIADKARHEYPGGYHEVFNDTNRAEPLAAVVAWLDQHLDATRPAGV